MIIVDRHGVPIKASGFSNYDSGSNQTNDWRLEGTLSGENTTPRFTHRVNRDRVRTITRYAFLSNALVYGAVNTIHGFVMGEGLTYGELADEEAQEQLEAFFMMNDLGELANRFFWEFMIDGENLTLFPKQDSTSRARSSEAARVGFFDVANSFRFKTPDGMPTLIDGLSAGSKNYELTEFAYTGHLAGLHNDPRGWPVLMQAIPAAITYYDFIQLRLRAHDLQGRINGLYKAFVYASDATAARDELVTKAATFGGVPTSGQVATLAKDPQSGNSEDFELFTTNTNARDAESDARIIHNLFAVGVGLPEHYLAFGGNTTRTTADSMSAPAKKGLERHQARVKAWADKLMRLELIRRNGEGRTYTVRKRRALPGQNLFTVDEMQVTASMLEMPWQLPTVDEDNLTDTLASIRYLHDREQPLVSDQTVTGRLGFDYALEQEQMGAEAVEGES